MKNLLAGTMLLALSAGAASAADLPSRAAPPVFVAPVAAYSWTGFEAGLMSAYGFASDNHVSTRANGGVPAGDIRPSYVTTRRDKFNNVGAVIGYNYQFTPGSGIVVGVAASADWVDMRKDTFIYGSKFVSDYHQRLSWLGTANGHLGYAFDRFLAYGIGGFAYGDPGVGANFLTPPAVNYYGGNNGKLRGGYDYGGGIAYAIPNDSFLNKFAIEKMLGFDKFLGLGNTSTVLKVEYIHYDLGNQNVTLRGVTSPGSYNLRFHTEGNQVRAGLLYSFGGFTAVPVVARY